MASSHLNFVVEIGQATMLFISLFTAVIQKRKLWEQVMSCFRILGCGLLQKKLRNGPPYKRARYLFKLLPYLAHSPLFFDESH